MVRKFKLLVSCKSIFDCWQIFYIVLFAKAPSVYFVQSLLPFIECVSHFFLHFSYIFLVNVHYYTVTLVFKNTLSFLLWLESNLNRLIFLQNILLFFLKSEVIKMKKRHLSLKTNDDHYLLFNRYIHLQIKILIYIIFSYKNVFYGVTKRNNIN